MCAIVGSGSKQYYQLEEFSADRDSPASLSLKERLSRLFCCFSPSHTLEDSGSQASAPKVEQEPKKKKKIKKQERSPSLASTDSDSSGSPSRTPSPVLSPTVPLVVARPTVSYSATAAPDLLRRLQQGPDQSMARAIHDQRTQKVVKPVEVRIQPRAETIERLVKQIEALSSQTPQVVVSHQIGDRFQVNVDYIQKNGPMAGGKGRKTFLIPVEEIRTLGSSSSTEVLDLGAHLRAHLRENFSFIEIQ